MHTHSAALAPSKPFLKWAGGKTRLLPQLLPLLPHGRRLIEPFVGAGSVFLAGNYQQFVINDANPDIVAIWVALRERPAELVERASKYFSRDHLSEDAFKRVRDEFNTSTDRFERAVLFIYLNRFGFNGLYRVNRSGCFNVPYGRPATLPAFPWEQLESAAAKLGRCLVLNGGFEATMELAGSGDVVYCDPPYLDQDGSSSFTAYTADRFGPSQHRKLVDSALIAARRGARVVISNHDTPVARALYADFQVHTLAVRRSISANASSRGLVNELVAVL